MGASVPVNIESTSKFIVPTPGTFPLEDGGSGNIDRHLNMLSISVIEFQASF